MCGVNEIVQKAVLYYRIGQDTLLFGHISHNFFYFTKLQAIKKKKLKTHSNWQTKSTVIM